MILKKVSLSMLRRSPPRGITSEKMI